MKKTEVIKIDRSTIRKNPRAGATVTLVPGLVEISFKYTGKELPALLRDENKAHVVSYGNDGVFEGVIENGALDEVFALQEQGIEGYLQIYQTQDVERILHRPDPKWLYKYEDTKVTCSECGGKVSHEDVNDENYRCPHCEAEDTFGFVYEEIDDVVNLDKIIKENAQ